MLSPLGQQKRRQVRRDGNRPDETRRGQTGEASFTLQVFACLILTGPDRAPTGDTRAEQEQEAAGSSGSGPGWVPERRLAGWLSGRGWNCEPGCVGKLEGDRKSVV